MLENISKQSRFRAGVEITLEIKIFRIEIHVDEYFARNLKLRKTSARQGPIFKY